MLVGQDGGMLSTSLALSLVFMTQLCAKSPRWGGGAPRSYQTRPLWCAEINGGSARLPLITGGLHQLGAAPDWRVSGSAVTQLGGLDAEQRHCLRRTKGRGASGSPMSLPPSASGPPFCHSLLLQQETGLTLGRVLGF